MATTDISEAMRRDGHRLLQVGALLFLLGLLVGLGVPRFAVPRLALSTHLLGIMQGTFLMVAGMLWPRLELSRALSRVGLGLAIYGCAAAWMANLCGAAWGASGSFWCPARYASSAWPRWSCGACAGPLGQKPASR